MTVAAPPPGAEASAEVAVDISPAGSPGTVLPARATASWAGGSAELAAEITVAEPGWTMWMVSHFHYDPVWWSTQGRFLESRLLLPDDQGEMPEVRTAFELVTLHLDAARRDPDYKFVLAELDYLKPHFDAHPEDRADLLSFISAGRIELVGGTYNEPNTNLTCAESTIRNAVYGVAYQRDVLGGDPRTSWMLDAFGFDPAYPGIMAAAGLTSSSWARGPFHQWGPGRSAGGNELMQFDVRVRVAVPRRHRPAHQLHGQSLLGRVAGRSTPPGPGQGRGRCLQAVPPARTGRRDPQRAAAGRRRPRRPGPLGDRHPPGLELPLHLAEVRHRRAERVLRRGPG